MIPVRKQNVRKDFFIQGCFKLTYLNKRKFNKGKVAGVLYLH